MPPPPLPINTSSSVAPPPPQSLKHPRKETPRDSLNSTHCRTQVLVKCSTVVEGSGRMEVSVIVAGAGAGVGVGVRVGATVTAASSELPLLLLLLDEVLKAAAAVVVFNIALLM